jgi:hypothetical protein
MRPDCLPLRVWRYVLGALAESVEHLFAPALFLNINVEWTKSLLHPEEFKAQYGIRLQPIKPISPEASPLAKTISPSP